MKSPSNIPDPSSLDEETTPKEFSFVKVLKRALNEPGGNRNALTIAIEKANKDAGSRFSITYEKLGGLIEDECSVGLTLQDLIALHFYLKIKGEGLDEKPIFDKSGILSRLVECGRLSVFFGAYPNVSAHRNDVSLWDNRAAAVLVKEVGKLNRHVQINTQDVLWAKDHAKLCENVRATVDHLDREESSIISIGTPRACMATEVLLSSAFNVPPRSKPMANGLKNPPFHFVWPPELQREIKSSFSLTGQDLTRLGSPKIGRRVESGQSSALIVGDEVFETPLNGTKSKWPMHGVIVAQRRARGNVWLVISGISGPATQACAEKVAEMTDNLPITDGKNGPVLWAVVKAVVSVDKSGRGLGDRRRVDSYELLGGPHVWPISQNTSPDLNLV